MKGGVVTVNGKKYNVEDMANWFIQIRKFRTILCFGHGRNQVCGEGQSGGRYVSDIAHLAEEKLARKMGIVAYRDAVRSMITLKTKF